MVAPRYFIPHGDEKALPAPADAAIVEIVDELRLGGQTSAHKRIVARDLSGALLLVDEAALGVEQRDAMVANELARGGAPRTLWASELWLLLVELLEQPPAPGHNDPVHLYGALFGPFSSSGGELATARQGRLSVTRGDVLEGLLVGHNSAFAVPGRDGGGSIVHMLLPGDGTDAIREGRGIVLAYPLFPVDNAKPAGNNDALVCQLLHDVVHALQSDVREGAPPSSARGGFADLLLPVLDRGPLEAKLGAEGFTIKGDVAVRGLLGGEKRPLPKEGGLVDFLAAARLAEQALGFPDDRSRVLFSRMAAHQPDGFARAVREPPRPSSTPRPVQPYRKEEPRWMDDFAEPATGKPHGAPQRATRVDKPRPKLADPQRPATTTSGKPDWMKDFE